MSIHPSQRLVSEGGILTALGRSNSRVADCGGGLSADRSRMLQEISAEPATFERTGDRLVVGPDARISKAGVVR